MDSKEAMDIGMNIAERHTAAALDILRVKPDATLQEALRGTQIWLAAQIMVELQKTAEHTANKG